tara:strand:- start:404 stop:559 length:156 start_codon:yes stop_codon:yes gene_type:complete
MAETAVDRTSTMPTAISRLDLVFCGTRRKTRPDKRISVSIKIMTLQKAFDG